MSVVNYLIVSLYLFNLCIGIGCKWTVSNQTLNLRHLSGKKLQTVQIGDNGQVYSNYNFSICANSEVCGDIETMAAQFPTDLPGYCFNAGSYNASINPIYSAESGGSWTFTYLGDSLVCPQRSEWIPTFVCNSTTEYSISTVTEPSTCQYYVTIQTKVYVMYLYIYDNVYYNVLEYIYI